jgi:hypothetical protein
MRRLLQVAFTVAVMGSLVDVPESACGQPEPPVRLRKKPKADPAKGQGDSSAAKQGTEESRERKSQDKRDVSRSDAEELTLQEKVTESFERLSKDFISVQDALGKANTGGRTQELQQDIVKGLDELIEKSKQQSTKQKEQQASSAGSRRNQRLAGQRLRQTRPSLPSQLSAREQNQQLLSSEPGSAIRPGKNKIEELYKDVWGHLPESLRQEMNQYAREQFMPKYGDLLKQYYATIAEKGRRKSEGPGARN